MLIVWRIEQNTLKMDSVAKLPTDISHKSNLLFGKFYLIAEMAKRKFNLTAEQEQELQDYIDACTHAPTRTRYQAILFYYSGMPVEEITNRLGCSRASVMNWCQVYRLLGIKILEDQRVGGNNAKLSPEQLDDLVFRINTLTPRNVFDNRSATEEGDQWTVEDLYKAIKDWYGVRYRSRTSYYTLLDSSKSNHKTVSEQDEVPEEE